MKINIEIITENGTGKNINGPIEIDERLLDLAFDKADFISRELRVYIRELLKTEPNGDTPCQK